MHRHTVSNVGMVFCDFKVKNLQVRIGFNFNRAHRDVVIMFISKHFLAAGKVLGIMKPKLREFLSEAGALSAPYTHLIGLSMVRIGAVIALY